MSYAKRVQVSPEDLHREERRKEGALLAEGRDGKSSNRDGRREEKVGGQRKEGGDEGRM